MGVGSYLSEQSAEEYVNSKKHPKTHTISGALIMFFSYFAAGFIPLAPYMVLKVPIALPVSIILSFVALFLLGMVSATFLNIKPFRQGIKMLIIGGIAIVVGVIVGKTLNT